jgi:U3 small nucleolar RNA-associated protein 20
MVGAALGVLLRRAAPPRRDRLAQYCAQWLGGGDARLNRAAAQALGILAEVEGAGFARRVPSLLPQLADMLQSRAQQDEEAAEAAAEAELGQEEDLLAAAPGWQEAYYSLLLLQRLLECASAQLAWAAGPAAQRCWGGARRLLLHRHQWVRKASGRLVGAGLAAPTVGAPMLAAGGGSAAGEEAGGWHPSPCRFSLPLVQLLFATTMRLLIKISLCLNLHDPLVPSPLPLLPLLCRRAGDVFLPPAGL